MPVEEQYPETVSGDSFQAAPAVVMIHEPWGAAAESIGALRTQLVTQEIGNGLSALAVCTPSRDSGSTFVAVNLAVALSQIGVRTLLIDADLRHPAVDSLITPPHAIAGLQHCLSDGTDMSDIVQEDVLPNLSIIYSGGAAPNPQELLSGVHFRELLDFCSRDYDITIIDTPPANQSADNRYIGALTGAALVVARKNHSLVNDMRTLVGELERNDTRVIGTVLNDF